MINTAEFLSEDMCVATGRKIKHSLKKPLAGQVAAMRIPGRRHSLAFWH